MAVVVALVLDDDFAAAVVAVAAAVVFVPDAVAVAAVVVAAVVPVAVPEAAGDPSEHFYSHLTPRVSFRSYHYRDQRRKTSKLPFSSALEPALK